MAIYERCNGAARRARGAIRRFGEFRRTHIEMYERLYIAMEPWTHDILHWGSDGTLHGNITVCSALSPVSRSGWCPCHFLDATITHEGMETDRPPF